VIDAGTDQEIVALQKQLDDEHAALMTQDCTTACRALGSIRRAAERICVLDPGSTRCTEAQSKAEDARRRVRDACPDCAGAASKDEEERDKRATTKAGTGASAPAAAPPPRESRGGCASCSTAETTGNGADFGLLALGIWIVCRTSRKKSSRRM